HDPGTDNAARPRRKHRRRRAARARGGGACTARPLHAEAQRARVVRSPAARPYPSLHAESAARGDPAGLPRGVHALPVPLAARGCRDRKSTRLNSSHVKISYAVFCLKKKISVKSKARE